MALLEKQLYVKKSTLPFSGKGLFTKKFIPKGTRIVEYKGTVNSWKNTNHKDGENGYIMYLNRNVVIDAEPNKNHLGRYANDARGLQKVKGISNNSRYVREGNRVFIEADKNIRAGSEIFVGYGKEYWKTERANRRLEEQQKKRKS
jgi:uncharacterized protein